MSDSLVFSEIDQFYSKKKNHKKTGAEKDSAVRTRILKILVCVLSCVLVVEAILYLVVIPCTSSVQIVFSGLTQYMPEDIIKSTNLNVRQTWINFDTASIAQKLAASQLFESVKVEKSFPDKVVITLSERKCAAVAIAELNGKSVPVQIDKNGVVYRINAGVPAGDIPLLSGLSFENPKVGMRLHGKLRPLVQQISDILTEKPVYFSAISEIRIMPKDYGSYDLVLYPMHSKVRVLVDKTLNEESLQYMMVVLDVIDSLESDVYEVDLRHGSVSYKTRNSNESKILAGVSLGQNSTGVSGE